MDTDNTKPKPAKRKSENNKKQTGTHISNEANA